MRSRLAQQRQQYMARCWKSTIVAYAQGKTRQYFFHTVFLLEWCHEYLLFFFDVGFDLQQVQGGEIPKKVKVSSFHLRRTENSNLKHTKLQHYELGNTDIDTFGIAAPDGKVH